MANRRMFSKKISKSARFLHMSESARLLYYDLGMEADDEGFVEAMNVVRMTGTKVEALNELADKKYVCILNESGLCWITCWFENNYIQSDRKQPSAYHSYLDALRNQYPKDGVFAIEETGIDMAKLGAIRVSSNVSNSVYVSGYKNAENVSKSGYKLCQEMEPQDSIGKDRLDKGSKDNIIIIATNDNSDKSVQLEDDDFGSIFGEDTEEVKELKRILEEDDRRREREKLAAASKDDDELPF